MRNNCVEFSVAAETVYRTFLDLVRHELDIAGAIDINSIQAFILLNIDDNTVTLGEIVSRGYYVGSNASYNIRKMISNGYINQLQSHFDKRTSYLQLTDKGKKLLQNLKMKILEYTKSFESKAKEKNDLYKVSIILRNVSNHWREILSRGR